MTFISAILAAESVETRRKLLCFSLFRMRQSEYLNGENANYFLTAYDIRVIIPLTGAPMTIEEIAKKFNINISTVSKALNGSTDIAESTRKAVCEYAESVGYKTRRSRKPKGTIAVLVGDRTENGVDCRTVAEAFRACAEAENYAVAVQPVTRAFDGEAFFRERPFTGVFALGFAYDSPLLRVLESLSIPVVYLGNRFTDRPHVSAVQPDELNSVSKAVDLLVAHGHNLIAYVGEEKDSLESAERFAGYFFGLSKNAIPYRYDLTYFGDASPHAGANAADYFLSYQKFFTAAICSSCRAARGLIAQLRGAGKNVPLDVSVIAFGEDTEKLPVTRYAPDCRALGEKAFAVLRASAQGVPAQHVTVPCVLKEKDATCTKKRNFE